MDEDLVEQARKLGYDLICKRCIDMFFEKGKISISVSEKVVGAQCWRCTDMASEDNPVYRMVLQNKRNVK